MKNIGTLLTQLNPINLFREHPYQEGHKEFYYQMLKKYSDKPTINTEEAKTLQNSLFFQTIYECDGTITGRLSSIGKEKYSREKICRVPIKSFFYHWKNAVIG